jgi:hypothetical protein
MKFKIFHKLNISIPHCSLDYLSQFERYLQTDLVLVLQVGEVGMMFAVRKKERTLTALQLTQI